jgi:membrane protein
MKFSEKIKQWLRHLWRAANMWWRHKHADEAAALAFYSLISLVPILLVGIFVASIFVDEKTATQILLTETHRVAGSSVGTYFAQILQSDIRSGGAGASPAIGLLFLFYSATKMIAELRKSLGKVFGAPRKKGRKAAFAGVVGRLASLAMLLILGVFIASAVIFETMASVALSSVHDYSWVMRLATGLAPVLSFCGMTFLSAIAMRWLPVRPPLFKEALIGGAVSALLLLVLKIGLAQFLAHSQFGSIYGSAVTLVLVLFWIYFAMQVFLYGAELAAELAQERRKNEDNQHPSVAGTLQKAREVERKIAGEDR